MSKRLGHGISVTTGAKTSMKFLVTGAAGFIGYYVSQRLCDLGHEVVGLDNLNDYYEVELKQDRLSQLEPLDNFRFIKGNFSDSAQIATLFEEERFERVIHLGAQAGVRYSIEAPMAYAHSNLTGHLNILEGCRNTGVGHLVYASSSSVYGMNTKVPFSTADSVDHPVSLYAATKKSNELMSHTYSHLYQLPTTGLRFFTVYGPWGRPDMAPIKFARLICEGKKIEVYNHGNLSRDFTYIDDIVEGILRIQDIVPEANPNMDQSLISPATSSAPYRLYNIGHGSPVKLMTFIEQLETSLGRVADKQFVDMQPGDVYQTWADTDDLFQATDYKPRVGIEEGVSQFAHWFKSYYQV